MYPLIAIFVGGGLGSLARFGLSRWLGSSENGFPIGTLVANLIACLILGFASAIILKKMDVSPTLQAGIMAGFCGGFSTFSTFSLESFALIQGDKAFIALGYILVSVIVCITAIWLGSWLGGKM